MSSWAPTQFLGGRGCCRALNACACLLPRQRCLGACSRRWKALKLVQQLPSKAVSPETASTAAAGQTPAAGDKPRGDSSDIQGRRDPGSLLSPTWLEPTLTPAAFPALPHQSHCRPCPVHLGDSVCDALCPPPSPGPHPQHPSAISLAAHSSPYPTPICSSQQIHWGWRWCDCSEHSQRHHALRSVGACTGR